MMLMYMPLVMKWSQGKDVTSELMVIHAQADVDYRIAFGGGIEEIKQVDEDELF